MDPSGPGAKPSTELSERIAGLTPDQRALLRRRLADRQPKGSVPISRRPAGEPAVLSFAQWRLWFLEQMRPGSSAWHTPIAVRIHGPLRPDLLREALAVVVERHAPLRTVFRPAGGRPEPVEVSDASVEVPLIDLERFRLDLRERVVERLVQEIISMPFDLTSDLMVRARLLRLTATEHVLVLVAHHIACDGWSKGLLIDELCVGYDALIAGERPQLPHLPVDYADYARWEQQRLSGQHLERLEAYWRERLAGDLPVLEIPDARRRPPTLSFAGATVPIRLSRSLADAAAGLGREERATPFMTFLAAFKALLYGLNGQVDVLVGSPSAMRHHVEVERLIGLFANTLVYRTDLSGSPSFRTLVGRVRDTAVGVYAHQELPFEKIVAAANPPRDASRNPLVQANFRLEGEEAELRLQDLQVERIELDPGIARFDLAIELSPTADGLTGYLEYNTDLIGRPTAEGLAAAFARRTEALVAEPDQPLDSLPPMREIRARRPDTEVA